MKRIIGLVLVLSLLFSLSACSKISSLFSKNSEQNFSYPISEMPQTLDPQIADDEAALIVIENCMEGLVRTDSKGEIVPAVASSWDVSANGLVYTFHLNSGAKWVIDEDFAIEGFNPAITANDFVFAIERAVLKQTAAPDFQSVSQIKNASKIHSSGSSTASLGVKAVNDSTLRITLESPNSAFLSTLTNAVFMPCNEQFFEYCGGRYGRQAQYFLSNAGFELRSWNETNLVMRKNESYSLSNPAKPDSVTLYKDANAFESFAADNYDALAVGDDYIDAALADQTLRVQSYDDTVWSLGLNCKSDLCASRSLRRALMMCLDNSLPGAPSWAKQAQGIVPNICKTDGVNYRENAQCSLIAYAPDRASVLFQSFLERYLTERDETQLPVFRLLCTAAFEQSAKEIVQGWQQSFGTEFDVKIEVLSLGELKESLSSGDYDGVIAPWDAGTTDALVFLKQFGADNSLGYESTAFKHAMNSSASEKRKCLNCENLLLADAVLYPMFTSNSYYVQRNNIDGIYFYAFGGKVNFLNAERVK